ncbi:hypothetical protein V498_06688 [Pseudogymnoascus sp. VKM F-4517 (FW-2822)]|nr:hypothetical protein V498_06688 [Pseudogymnoascus sp. VKM F-4517 (FW-2822)]
MIGAPPVPAPLIRRSRSPPAAAMLAPVRQRSPFHRRSLSPAPAPAPAPGRASITPPPAYFPAVPGSGLAFSPVANPIMGVEINVGTWVDTSVIWGGLRNVVVGFFDRHGCLHFRVTERNTRGEFQPFMVRGDPEAVTILSIRFRWPYSGLAPARLCTMIDRHTRLPPNERP